MVLDARELAAEKVPSFDVCIVGAGAAGISIARALRNSSLSVGLLEGGGFEPDDGAQGLNEGEVAEGILREGDDYLSASRVRMFGGTTARWSGWCRPLDAIDFEKRDAIPHSGWPITRADLDPFYPEAARLLQVDPFNDGLHEGVGLEPGQRILQNEVFNHKRYQLSPPTRFADQYRKEITGASNITTILNANVTRVIAEGTRAGSVEVKTLGGHSFNVKAGRFVLATGGIENPRILLNSGIGNEQDLVGRFFMEHPHYTRAGRVFLHRPPDLDPYDPAVAFKKETGREVTVLCPSADTMREHGLQNLCIQVMDFHGRVRPWVTDVAHTLSNLDRYRTDDPPTGETAAKLYVRAEQAPNRESRVTLTDAVDALGMRKPRLDWRLIPQDAESIYRAIRLLGRELGRAQAGHAMTRIKLEKPWDEVATGRHHIGTTRMHADPKQGVVDADARVHSLDNLYIAGSSVFTTSGFANPTLSIVALALRLADHLKKEGNRA